MIIVNSYSDIRPFQFIESATIEVESFKDFYTRKNGSLLGSSSSFRLKQFEDYLTKLEQTSQRIFASVKHCTLATGPINSVFDAVIFNVQYLGDFWELDVFVRDKDGHRVDLLTKWDIDYEWDDFWMMRLNISESLSKHLKLFSLSEGQELCLQLKGAILPLGSAVVMGTGIAIEATDMSPQVTH